MPSRYLGTYIYIIYFKHTPREKVVEVGVEIAGFYRSCPERLYSTSTFLAAAGIIDTHINIYQCLQLCHSDLGLVMAPESSKRVDTVLS